MAIVGGVDPVASRRKNHEYYVVNVGTDTGTLVSEFNQLGKEQRDRILGYVAAFTAMKKQQDAGE